MRIVYVVALSLCLTFAVVSPALAHTQVVSTDPARGASLERTPQQVSLKLGGPVEAEFSPLEVYDGRGERVDLDDAHTEYGGESIVVGLKDGLGGGEYEVEYRYTGVDGHPIEGSYSFSVSGAPEPVVSGASAGGQPSSESGGASSLALYGALGLGALAVAGAGGFVVMRRR